MKVDKTGEKMLAIVEKSQEMSFFLRLNSIPNKIDAIPNDVVYQRSRWISTEKVIADTEIINIVKYKYELEEGSY